MRRWLPASFIAGAWVFSIAVYSRLPDRVPVHWGMSGEPNRYGSRIEGAFLLSRTTRSTEALAVAGRAAASAVAGALAPA